MKINKNKLIKEYLSKSCQDVEIISENNLEVIVRILLMDMIKKEPTTKELLKQICNRLDSIESNVFELKLDVVDIKSRLVKLEVEARNRG